MSDFSVGVFRLRLSSPPVSDSRSSGAHQRIVPPALRGVEVRTETEFLASDERPKSARRGLPRSSMRMLGWGHPKVSTETTTRNVEPFTHALQVSVNHLDGMKMVEAARDPT